MEKDILIIGAGTMGSGIAHVFICHNYRVMLIDTDKDQLKRAKELIKKRLKRLEEKKKISRISLEYSLSHLFCQSLDSMDWSDEPYLIIEAITESYKAKRKIFEMLANKGLISTILATNTSSISVTKLASGLPFCERLIGMHFFNPVPVMALVEIISGTSTSQKTIGKAEDIVKSIGKTPILVQDSPGFVSNRVLMPMINEAIFCLYEQVAGVEQIDAVMRLGMAHPMGPLRLADLIGLDVCLSVLMVLYEGFRDTKYRPCPLLVKMVDAGYLGKKAGKGFYHYD